MSPRTLRKLGHVRMGNQRLRGFIHGDMSIQAKPKQAKVNRAVPGQPLLDTLALCLWIVGIASESCKTVRLNGQWPQKFRIEISFTSAFTPQRQPAPLID